MKGQMKFQIGKNGITTGILESLELAFKTHKVVRVSALKSSERNKKKIREMADYIAGKLKGNYTYKIIGFTIVVKKVGLKKKK